MHRRHGRVEHDPADDLADARAGVDREHLPQRTAGLALEVPGATILLPELLVQVPPAELDAPHRPHPIQPVRQPRVEIQRQR